jgi:hypothetical protein
MKSNTQNTKIAAITEKTLIIGIDVGSETHFARAFNWRRYEFSRKPLEFSNTEEGGVTKEEAHQGNVRRKVLMSGNWSQQTTKNEPVVGGNFVHRARPCKGAKLTPWLWPGGTKEVRTRGKPKVILVDTGGALP